MKDELRQKILTEFVTLKSKTNSYLTDENKNVKRQKKVCHKRKT